MNNSKRAKQLNFELFIAHSKVALLAQTQFYKSK